MMQYFAANDVTNEKRKPIFLSSIGKQAYKRLKKLCIPVQPANKTFPELCLLLKKHFHPEPICYCRKIQISQARPRGGVRGRHVGIYFHTEGFGRNMQIWSRF